MYQQYLILHLVLHGQTHTLSAIDVFDGMQPPGRPLLSLVAAGRQ